MSIYDQLAQHEREVVDGLIGTCVALDWRQRHRLFMSFAERVLERLLDEFDTEDAEDRVNQVVAVTMAAAIERLDVTNCDDAWCALNLLHSAREDHRQLGLNWAEGHPEEWAIVELEIVQPVTH
jgi:hypothetical protein